MIRPAHSVLTLMLASCLLAACNGLLTPAAERRQKAFVEVAENYRKLIRWGYFEQAAGYLRAKDGDLPQPDLARLAKYKVTGYQTGEQMQNEAFDEVRVVAQIEFYDMDTGIAGSARDDQYWWFDQQTSRWYLGSPMPIFARPAETAPTRRR
jgi:hypothetical protein